MICGHEDIGPRNYAYAISHCARSQAWQQIIMFIRKEGPVDIVKYATYKVFHKLLDKGHF